MAKFTVRRAAMADITVEASDWHFDETDPSWVIFTTGAGQALTVVRAIKGAIDVERQDK